VSFLNKVARLMVRCQRRKRVFQSFPRASWRFLRARMLSISTPIEKAMAV
jgi:hypothetical protein